MQLSAFWALLLLNRNLHQDSAMKELLKILQLSVYVFALPLIATATVSAFNYLEKPDTKVETSKSEIVDTNQENTATYLIKRDQNQTVKGRVVNVDGGTGEVNGRSGLSVQFVQNQNVVFKTETDSTGNFTVGNVPTGVYSFFAIGDGEFLTMSIRIVNPSERGADSLFVESTVGKTAKMAVEKIRSLRSQSGFRLKSMTLEDRTEFTKLTGSSSTTLSDDGTLVGRAVSHYREANQKLEGTTVQIYQDGKLIAETKTDAMGKYTIKGLDEGVYELFAFGPAGFATFRFRTVLPAKATSAAAVELPKTALQETQEFALTPFNNATFADPPVVDTPPVDTPPIVGDTSTAFVTGGSAPVGGGFPIGGGGRLGRLVGLAALGVGIAALAEDDSPPPTSPTL